MGVNRQDSCHITSSIGQINSDNEVDMHSTTIVTRIFGNILTIIFSSNKEDFTVRTSTLGSFFDSPVLGGSFGVQEVGVVDGAHVACLDAPDGGLVASAPVLEVLVDVLEADAFTEEAVELEGGAVLALVASRVIVQDVVDVGSSDVEGRVECGVELDGDLVAEGGRPSRVLDAIIFFDLLPFVGVLVEEFESLVDGRRFGSFGVEGRMFSLTTGRG